MQRLLPVFWVPCQPLPCFLHVYLLQLLAAGCVHVSVAAWPTCDWGKKWVCQSAALDKAGQLKSVHLPPTPRWLGWAWFIFSSFLTGSRLFLDPISVFWQALHFCQLPGVYDSQRHGKMTLSNRTSIPLWQKIDSSKAIWAYMNAPVTEHPNHWFPHGEFCKHLSIFKDFYGLILILVGFSLSSVY